METEKYLNVVFRQETPMRKFLERQGEPTLVIKKVVNDMLKSPHVAFRSADEMRFIRILAIEQKVDKETSRLELGQLKHLVSTREVDRTREVMLPKGVRLENYRKNPVVLWSHTPYEPENVIGKNLWIKPDDDGVLALTQFNMSAEKASGIFRLFRDGWLKAWSIGFIPMRGRRATKEDVKGGLFKMPDDATFNEDDVYLHEKWELLEYSAVAVPACAGALNTDDIMSLGLCEDLQKELGIGQVVDLSHTKYYDIGGVTNGDGKKQEGGAAAETPDTASGEGAEDGGADGGDPIPGIAGGGGAEHKGDDGLGGRDGEGPVKDAEAPDGTKAGDGTGIKPEDYDEVLKPFPGAHACRLIDPGKFEADSFRSYSRDHEGKKYTVIAGKLKGESTMTEQGFRYAKETWTVAEARKHCKAHDGIEFAPATESSMDMPVCTDEVVERVMSELEKRIKTGRIILPARVLEGPFIRVVKDQPLDIPKSGGILKVKAGPGDKPVSK